MKKINLFNQYKHMRIEDRSNFLNQKLSIVNIHNKKTNKLFEDEYIDMEIPFNNYELIRTENKANEVLNLYSVDDNKYLAIIYYKAKEKKLSKLNEVIKHNNPDIDINKVYKRYSINDIYDLVYNVIYYSSIDINYQLSIQEITDGVFFESLRSILFNGDSNEQIDEIIFFKNDKYGYALVSDKSIRILLINNNHEYNIIINSSDTLSITKKQLIQMISTLNYNE